MKGTVQVFGPWFLIELAASQMLRAALTHCMPLGEEILLREPSLWTQRTGLQEELSRCDVHWPHERMRIDSNRQWDYWSNRPLKDPDSLCLQLIPWPFWCLWDFKRVHPLNHSFISAVPRWPKDEVLSTFWSDIASDFCRKIEVSGSRYTSAVPQWSFEVFFL